MSPDAHLPPAIAAPVACCARICIFENDNFAFKTGTAEIRHFV
ncbi:hypothetical protein C8N35_101113 [Breoghania corrubedonensis]|uniref:Uncharacterized protein n=1 Tax=Breoghania corrubedonensis TaxID=665038 RepID=A0A2T5VE97_9HYPH|nr:hypothetical protein C8N35_101113 [Breoghania corrubedonensis]